MISPGEPAGVGPDIVVKIAQQNWPAQLIVVSDPKLLHSRAKQLGLPLKLEKFDVREPITPHTQSSLKIIPVALNSPVEPGKLNLANATYVIKCLEIATDCCLHQEAQALVTGPIQKSIINEAGIAFSGHTEFLAQRCQVSDDIMLFVAEQMKVALLTTHLPLSEVPRAVTREKLIHTLRLLNSELKKRFYISNPKILVCGLNPHAGENGHLGREELDVIEPALKQLRTEKIDVIGPLPADTIFTEKYLETADAILAMYHDQALPVVKYLGFGKAVNVTLGLPIIRTSVDHGTALDVAGTHQADAGSLDTAILLAIELCTAPALDTSFASGS
ncbi:MAG: 4-hydroxythreonine-4-phosphate dehydrogenase PdxA [Gammaproteobacteria bacterium]